MTSDYSFQRFAAVSAIVSFPLAIASTEIASQKALAMTLAILEFVAVGLPDHQY